MTVHIIYSNYLNPIGSDITVGGVQTYITALAKVVKACGFNLFLYQKSSTDFEKEYNGMKIFGVNCTGRFEFQVKYSLYNRCRKIFNNEEDILIWGTDALIVKNHGLKRTIAIQHGIAWDRPEKKHTGFYYNWRIIRKMYDSFKIINRISYVNCLVCVDHNYMNWHRSLVPLIQQKMVVIPNFTKIPDNVDFERHQDEHVEIIFARRFFEVRGTRILSEAMIKILDQYPNVSLTISGTGPDEEYLKKVFKCNNRVCFKKYDSSDALEVHKNQHIAVVPSVGSEGTSLSLLEAMAAGCVVVCTNVGGMTNIVMDGHNGMICLPTSEDLYFTLRKVIDDKQLRMKLSKSAFQTVLDSFSLNRWEKLWMDVLNGMSGDL